MTLFKIAVIFPSRGLAFSETCDELLQNLQGFKYHIFFAHGKPIPQCFNEPLRKALDASEQFTHFFFVEDDMILPESTLEAMLLMNSLVVTCDYPVSKDGQAAVFTADKRVIFTGTGCLLVKREVFNALTPPYFRTDIKWNVINYGKFVRFIANESTQTDAYGLHDVNFGMKLLQKDIPIEVAGKIGQRKLIKLGKSGTNNGAHQIEEWRKVRPKALMNRYKRGPIQEIGKLVSVQTPKGELTVHPTHAKKLIDKGIATKSPKQELSIDFNGLTI